MKVKKAIIPAAGLGTRMLPASKALPKEMLPIVDKPAIQYIVEEAARAGIEDILIITNRGKTIIEDHFDRAPELEEKLRGSGKQELLEEVLATANLANIHYIRQRETKGLGHAVLCARAFVGQEPFAVLYGDDVILGDPPVTRQLCDIYEQTGKNVVGIKEVPTELLLKYCTLAVSPLRDNLYEVHSMQEKPSLDQIASHFAVLGRCVFSPEIFEIIEHTAPSTGGEIQLTDAMNELSHAGRMLGVDFVGTRYDMGNKLEMLRAIVEVGADHPEVGPGFRAYLKQFASKL